MHFNYHCKLRVRITTQAPYFIMKHSWQWKSRQLMIWKLLKLVRIRLLVDLNLNNIFKNITKNRISKCVAQIIEQSFIFTNFCLVIRTGWSLHFSLSRALLTLHRFLRAFGWLFLFFCKECIFYHHFQSLPISLQILNYFNLL